MAYVLTCKDTCTQRYRDAFQGKSYPGARLSSQDYKFTSHADMARYFWQQKGFPLTAELGMHQAVYQGAVNCKDSRIANIHSGVMFISHGSE